MNVTTYFQETHTRLENSCTGFYKSQRVQLVIPEYIERERERETDGQSDWRLWSPHRALFFTSSRTPNKLCFLRELYVIFSYTVWEKFSLSDIVPDRTYFFRPGPTTVRPTALNNVTNHIFRHNFCCPYYYLFCVLHLRYPAKLNKMSILHLWVFLHSKI